MKKRRNLWRWWAKALGEKASKCNRESDRIALIRSFIFATYLITNCFIVAGVIRQWNKETKIELIIDSPYERISKSIISNSHLSNKY
jgi:hypothetical protein